MPTFRAEYAAREEQRRRWSHVGPPELTWSLGLLLSAGVEYVT